MERTSLTLRLNIETAARIGRKDQMLASIRLLRCLVFVLFARLILVIPHIALGRIRTLQEFGWHQVGSRQQSRVYISYGLPDHRKSKVSDQMSHGRWTSSDSFSGQA